MFSGFGVRAGGLGLQGKLLGFWVLDFGFVVDGCAMRVSVSSFGITETLASQALTLGPQHARPQ